MAVALVGAQAYRSGVAFDLAVRLRHEPRGASSRNLHLAVSGHSYTEDDQEQRLLLGIELSDGRTATNLTPPWPPSDDDGPAGQRPLLSGGGGGGGGRTYDVGYFLSPLPPAGDLIVVCSWPVFGIEETRCVLDGSAIAAAGAAAVELWPYELASSEPFEPPAPVVPSGGWFARAVEQGR